MLFSVSFFPHKHSHNKIALYTKSSVSQQSTCSIILDVVQEGSTWIATSSVVLNNDTSAHGPQLVLDGFLSFSLQGTFVTEGLQGQWLQVWAIEQCSMGIAVGQMLMHTCKTITIFYLVFTMYATLWPKRCHFSAKVTLQAFAAKCFGIRN